MNNLINGTLLAAQIREELKEEITKLPFTVRLAVVIVDGDAASQIYVQNKMKACQSIGMESVLHRFAENATEEEVAICLKALAVDDNIHGILLQLPLPKHFDKEKLLKLIPAHKDVDGFSSENVGKLCLEGVDSDAFIACTPLGILQLLKSKDIELTGKNVVVVGKSNIVGKPIALLLLAEGATVTVCHRKTKNLAEFTKQADILIVAVGKRDLIDGNMVKDGVVVVDVGINRMENGKICGDVHFDSVQKKASAITPVPGGVGPMTIAMLLYNTYKAAKQQGKK